MTADAVLLLPFPPTPGTICTHPTQQLHPHHHQQHQQDHQQDMSAGDEVKVAATAATEAAAAAAAGPAADSAKKEGNDFLATLSEMRPGEKIKEGLRWYTHLEEEGTPLRPFIKSARESLNGVVGRVDDFVETGKAHASAAVEGLKPDLSWLGQEVGTIDDFARTHRELTVGAIGLAVALPSALGGVRRAALNGMVAAGGAAAMFAMSDFFERQKKKEVAGKAAGEEK